MKETRTAPCGCTWEIEPNRTALVLRCKFHCLALAKQLLDETAEDED